MICDVFKAAPGARYIALGDTVHAIIPGGPQGEADAYAIAETFKGLGLRVEMHKHTGATKQFKNEDGTEPVTKAELRPGDFVFKVVPSSTPQVTKRAEGARRDIMSEKVQKRVGEGLFTDHILGPESVAKSAAMREFMPDGEVEIDNVAAALARWAGKATDATVSPEHPSESFPMVARIVDRNVRAADGSIGPPSVYELREDRGVDVTGAGTVAPQFLPMTPGQAEDTKPRDMYSPTQPKDRAHADNVVPDDMDDASVDPFAILDDDDVDDAKKSTKSIRLGSGYVFARKTR